MPFIRSCSAKEVKYMCNGANSHAPRGDRASWSTRVQVYCTRIRNNSLGTARAGAHEFSMAVAPPSGSEAPYTQTAAADAPHGLLEKIEDFCSRPCFTESIADFASQHSSEFACEPNEGEHPVSLSRTPSHRTTPGRRHSLHTPPPHHTPVAARSLKWDSVPLLA